MNKKLLAAVLGATVAVSMLGGVASAEEVTANGDYTFEIIVKSYQSSYWQAAVKGIDAEKEALGVTANSNDYLKIKEVGEYRSIIILGAKSVKCRILQFFKARTGETFLLL